MKILLRRVFVLMTVALMLGFRPASAWASSLAEDLAASAPQANRQVIELAVNALECAIRRGETKAERITVIDYSKPSLEPRLWVFDLENRKLLYKELVAHGRNSGGNMARIFSNRPGSLQSSLGLFRTANTYQGRNGYSLRLHGLEQGVNDKAFARAIVMHGAPYVNPEGAKKMGRLGRSWGCPVLRPAITRELIDTIKNGQPLFVYHPDAKWLSNSTYLSCDAM